MLAEIQQFVNWARRRNPTAHTWRDYRCDLEQFAAAVGEKPLAEGTYKEVDRFVKEQVDRGLKPATINRRLAAVVSLYGYHAVEQQALVCRPKGGEHVMRGKILVRFRPETQQNVSSLAFGAHKSGEYHR